MRRSWLEELQRWQPVDHLTGQQQLLGAGEIDLKVGGIHLDGQVCHREVLHKGREQLGVDLLGGVLLRHVLGHGRREGLIADEVLGNRLVLRSLPGDPLLDPITSRSGVKLAGPFAQIRDRGPGGHEDPRNQDQGQDQPGEEGSQQTQERDSGDPSDPAAPGAHGHLTVDGLRGAVEHMHQAGSGEQDDQPTNELVGLELAVRMAQCAPRQPAQEHRHQDVQPPDDPTHDEGHSGFESTGRAPPRHGRDHNGQHCVQQPETIPAQRRIKVPGALAHPSRRCSDEVRGTDPRRDQRPHHRP